MNQSVSEARRSAGQKSSTFHCKHARFVACTHMHRADTMALHCWEDGAFPPALDTAGYMWLKMCELHGWKWHTPISHNIEISGRFLMCWHIWVASRITLPAGWILSLIQFEDFGEQVNKPRLPLVPGETAGTGARHHFYQTPHYWLPKVRVGFFIWVVGCYCNPNPIFVGSTLTELCIVTR